MSEVQAAAEGAAPAEEAVKNPGEGAAPAEAENEGKAASPNDGDDSAAEGAESEGQEGEQPKGQKHKGGFQKRISELTREKHDLARKLDMALSALGGKGESPDAPKAATTQSDKEPTPEQFEKYEDYVVAKAKHELRKETEAADANRRKAEAERTQAEKDAAFAKACKAAADRYEDFEEVVFTEALPVSPAMADVLKESEKGPDLAYYLGTHLDEAQRISRLSPLAAARELGRIEASLSTPAPRKTTKAPDPVKTVTGKDSPSKNPKDMSMDEYVAAREAGKI